jgi:predicted nucleotidyltransferase
MEIPDKRPDPGTIPSLVIVAELARAIAQCPRVIGVILYGSAATKRMTPLSDIDICVVTDPDLTRDEWEEIMSHTGPAIDLTVFQDLPPPIQYRVVRDGIVLYNRDRQALHRIRAEALRNYLDLQTFIHRNARRILHKPVSCP